MDQISPYSLIIVGSIILIISYFFGEISKRTSIPSVLLLIVLGVLVNFGLQYADLASFKFDGILEILGIVGLIMIVLEAALELKLDSEKIVPIVRALAIALIGLLLSTYVTKLVLQYFIEGMSNIQAWIYATPLSILSSAIIIPSVLDLRKDKKEFHIYESTFSDILGIMLFYFLTAQVHVEGDSSHGGGGIGNFALTTLLTILIAVVTSYLLVIVFQKIKSQVKLFLLISVLLLIYSVEKQAHLSSLLSILIFGLVISNMDIFFAGRLNKWLDREAAHEVYEGLHVITMETAFVVRTFFFVIFGITITFDSLASWDVLGISALCLLIIYVIRYIILRTSIGKDILPQLYIAPRGLITILLFNAIPAEVINENFSQGVLLYIILGTGVIMTIAMIFNKRRANGAINAVKQTPVRMVKWKLPE